MRIAQVSPLYESVPPKLYGGTERVVHYLTEELVRQGHDVTLFASGDSSTSAKLVPACSRATRLNPESIDGLAHHFVMLEKVLQSAASYDIIHFHIDYLHYPFTRRSTTPHVTTLHGRLDIPDLKPLYREFSEVPVVSISDAQRRPLDWLNWQATVYHGLPPDLLPPGDGWEGYLAFLGRISPEKGIVKAVEIAERAGMTLKVAAKIEHTDRKYFENEVQHLFQRSQVEYVGEINECEKAEFLGRAKALLFPIDWPEPFGLVMIEALSCGTPVIAFRAGSVDEVIEDGVSGFVVETIDEAVQAVGRIGELDRKKCRNAFETRFTTKRMVADYLKVYRQLQRRGTGPRGNVALELRS
jgi:glycosyltransferase involved in cell wall biosynthesis